MHYKTDETKNNDLCHVQINNPWPWAFLTPNPKRKFSFLRPICESLYAEKSLCIEY